MSKQSPPEWIFRFLEWFCPPDLYESIEGDLLEDFETDAVIRGVRQANLRLVWNVLNFFRPGIVLRNRFNSKLIGTSMLRSYVKVASRNILKQKFYSFVNVTGLGIGLGFCMLIFLFVKDELSFDRYHEHANSIYRVDNLIFDSEEFEKGNPAPYSAIVSLPLKMPELMLSELAEIEHMTRFRKSAGTVTYQDKVFKEHQVAYVDSGFFRMFSCPIVHGSFKHIFVNPLDAVVTESIALKYFGETDAVGKSFSFSEGEDKTYTVSAVVKDTPSNSSLQFDILLPIRSLQFFGRFQDKLNVHVCPAFVKVKSGIAMKGLKTNLDVLRSRYLQKSDEAAREFGSIPAKFKVAEYRLTALPNIHFMSSVSWDKVSDPKYSFILGGIALLILVIGSVNYICLTTTTSVPRRSEVAMRKVMGARSRQVYYQFIVESIVLSAISALIGFLLIMLFLPYFNDFTGKDLTLKNYHFIYVAGFGVAVAMVIGLLAGSYPSMLLSKIILKRNLSKPMFRNSGVTKSLVVFQFSLAMIFMLCSIFMVKQMEYLTTKELGYNMEQVIAIDIAAKKRNEADKSVEQFRNAMLGSSSIVEVAGVNAVTPERTLEDAIDPDGEKHTTYAYRVTHEYVDVMGIKITSGRNFNRDIISDSAAAIVNESLVKRMKWKNPLTETFICMGRLYHVVGVIKDYHFYSLEQKIEPMFLMMEKTLTPLRTILVKIPSSDIPQNLNEVRSAWIKLFPDRPFEYYFLDEAVAQQYRSYERWMRIANFSSIFSIVISCMGLFALAGINAVNRTREIGIRKVFGAQVGDIVKLLNKQYVYLVVSAFAISAPVSWYLINKWLSSFEYKIQINWIHYLTGFIGFMICVMLTLSYHAIKSALINPAETLKHE